MEKVVLVAFAAEGATPLETEDVRTLNERLLRDLDAARYSDLSLQIEDHETNDPVAAARTVPSPGESRCRSQSGPSTATSWRAGGCASRPLRPRWRAWSPRPSPVADGPDDHRHGAAARRTVTSLLYRMPTMTPHEFVAHWRDVHQPMSLRIHPQHTYVRNVVARALTRDPLAEDAVCEEGFASIDDVLEPARFYGADGTRPWEATPTSSATTCGSSSTPTTPWRRSCASTACAASDPTPGDRAVYSSKTLSSG